MKTLTEAPVATDAIGKARRRLLAVVISIALIVAAIAVWRSAWNELLTSEQLVAQERARQLDRTLLQSEAAVRSMRDTFLFGLALAERGRYSHPLAERVRDFGPGAEGLQEVFALEPGDAPAGTSDEIRLVGTLTGTGRVEDLDEARHHKVNAALSLSPVFERALGSVSDAVWAYFLAADEILLLAPSVPADAFHFRPSLFGKAFWVDALPENNPMRGTVVSDVYEDAAGQGIMITMSEPLWREEEFIGITAIDIGLATLRASLEVGDAISTAVMVDEGGLLVAQREEFAPGTKAEFPTAVRKDVRTRQQADGKHFWAYPVHIGQLWLVQSAPTTALRLAAARIALPQFGLLALIGGLAFVLLRLRGAMVQVHNLAQHDPLTGALNRRAFEEVASVDLEQCDRRGSPAVAMMIDADHFKRVNDGFGHATGDEVLRGIADIVRGAIRRVDRFGRYGGEEFIVLAPHTTLDEGMNLAERVRRRTEKATFSKESLTVTVSIGIAERAQGQSLGAALARADEALYLAKESGRNCVLVAHDDATLDIDELPRVAAARKAVRRTGDTMLLSRKAS